MIEALAYVFSWLMYLGGIFLILLGALTVFHWFKTPKSPSDDSNRLNNIASWWIGLTRPQVMGKAYKYFRQDVMDNVDDVESK